MKPEPHRARGADYKLVPIDSLHEDPANARAHPERNRATVRASLLEFGQVEPLVVQKVTGRVIGGNCRLGELRALGVEEVMVSEVDLDGLDATRLGLVLNRSAETAEWNVDTLGKLLQELDAEDALEGLGWDDAELSDLLDDLDDGDGSDDPGPPEVQEEAVSVLGEVYELGPHRLVCGDSTSAEVWGALLGDERLRMVWSDPPYGVKQSTDHLREWDGGKKRPRKAHGIINDDLDTDGLRQLLEGSLGMAAAHCKNGAAWYVAAPAGPLLLQFASALHDLGIWRQTLEWVKDSFVLGRQDYHARQEPIFYGWVPGAAHYFIDDRTQDTVHECPRPRKSEEHPTMKPVPLVARHIRNSSKTGWLVGDPFAGSGTTLIACAETGRVARCIELDPRYCDVIRRRWTRWAKEHTQAPGPGALE